MNLKAWFSWLILGTWVIGFLKIALQKIIKKIVWGIPRLDRFVN